MSKVTAIVTVAMSDETQPFLQACQLLRQFKLNAVASAYELQVQDKTVLLIQSGIGMCNAVASVMQALSSYDTDYIISAGSAGGMGKDIRIGDVVVGTDYKYNGADASAFGYEIGQIPQMPPKYTAGQRLLQTLVQLDLEFKQGQIISGDSFITAENIDDKQNKYPTALATDMETTALAQLAYLQDKEFVSVRGISDLCGPKAHQDFYFDLNTVVTKSANVVLDLINRL